MSTDFTTAAWEHWDSLPAMTSYTPSMAYAEGVGWARDYLAEQEPTDAEYIAFWYDLEDAADETNIENIRAAQAERERDAWKALALEEYENLERAVKERDEASGAQPRPLTADDITDEMVERALDAADRYEAVVINKTVLRKALTAALTEPQRPEGAEGVQRAVEDYLRARLTLPVDEAEPMADFLAERGVRVTGAES